MSALHSLRNMRRRSDRREHQRDVIERSLGPATSFNPRSKRQKQLELMRQARRWGWRGRSYRKAKRFEQFLQHQARAIAAFRARRAS